MCAYGYPRDEASMGVQQQARLLVRNVVDLARSDCPGNFRVIWTSVNSRIWTLAGGFGDLSLR